MTHHFSVLYSCINTNCHSFHGFLKINKLCVNDSLIRIAEGCRKLILDISGTMAILMHMSMIRVANVSSKLMITLSPICCTKADEYDPYCVLLS
jgi:hypothetical protein